MNLKSLYSKTYNFVYLRAKSILEKEDEIQQLMKEVYLQANTKHIDETQMYEWLGKKTYTLGCAKFRKKKVREAELIEWDKQVYAAANPVVSEDAKEVICEAVEELPDMYFGTFLAFGYDHMSIKEVSAIMGYSVGAIIHRLNYTHKYLERAISNYCEENNVSVQFSVSAVCEAISDWVENNQLNKVVAQNVYASICRELGVRTDSLDEDADGGLSVRMVRCEDDEVEMICAELEAYSVKRKITDQQLKLLVGAGAAIILILIIILIASGSRKKESTEKQKEKEFVSDEVVNEDEPEVFEEEADIVDTSEYILPDSNTRKLTKAELEGLTREELRLARNEIYARYGMIFGAADLKEYFGSKSWYQPEIPYDDFYDSVEISEIEAANVKLIIEMEDKLY